MAPPKLLDQVSAVARLRHLSIRTEKAYSYHIKQFILFHNKRHPKEMSEDEIRAYLMHLAVGRHVSASTQNVALASLLFLYRDVLKFHSTESTMSNAPDRQHDCPSCLVEKKWPRYSIDYRV